MFKKILPVFLLLSFNSFAYSDASFDAVLAQIANGENTLCAEANLFKLKVSIRSLNSVLCGTERGAALAELICPVNNVDNYQDSECHKKAVKTLDGRSPLLILLNDLRTNGQSYENVLCKMSNLSDSAQKACEIVKLARVYLPYLK